MPEPAKLALVPKKGSKKAMTKNQKKDGKKKNKRKKESYAIYCTCRRCSSSSILTSKPMSIMNYFIEVAEAQIHRMNEADPDIAAPHVLHSLQQGKHYGAW
ncbi:unnamed protein product [Staurois parvus]|uniref:Uncharacterized protein n=1 Tax=Staurois parvus TaxID=386267 RepID=A0ABN9FV61_9NEOB|nr:unnamed protein product [Staurois parvus]